MECPNSSLSNTTSGPGIPENEVLSAIGKAIMDVGVPIVCAIGLLGNLLNMLVLSREKMQRNLSKMEKSAHYGMIALAFSDFMFCLLAVTYTIMPAPECFESRSVILYFNLLLSPSITIFIITSTMMIVYMAAERYLAVCHPFKARRIISLRRTRIIITMVFVGCTLATTPIFMENGIVKENYDGRDFYKIYKVFDHKIIVIRRLCWSVLFDLLPCGLLIYFNTCLIYSIKKAKKLRMNMAPLNEERRGTINRNSANFSYRHKQRSHTTDVSLRPENNSVFRDENEIRGAEIEAHLRTEGRSMRSQSVTHRRRHTETALNSVTATLVSIVVMFLVLVSPSEILKFSFYLSHVDSAVTNIIRDITNFMQALNFSANFILYCVMNKYFRETLVAMFCFYTDGHGSLSKRSDFPTISLKGSPSSS